MTRSRCHVLILDVDQDALLTLQHVLEDASIDTTITWDENEARQLLERTAFDLVVVGDRPPQIDAAALARGLSAQAGERRWLILYGTAEPEIGCYPGLNVIGTAARHDAHKVLEQIQTHCVGKPFKGTPVRNGGTQAYRWQTAS